MLALTVDRLGQGIKEQVPVNTFFPDDFILCSVIRVEVVIKLEEWKSATEMHTLKSS